MLTNFKAMRHALLQGTGQIALTRRVFWQAGSAAMALALARGLTPGAAFGETRPEMPVMAPAVEEQFDSSAPSGDAGAYGSQTATLSKASLDALETAIGRYASIVEAGGWPQIPAAKVLRTGSRDEAVSILRRRLAITGDLGQISGRVNVFDSYVEQAVRRFQRRNGLIADGIVQEATLKALNVPASERLHQLRANHERIREFLRGIPSRFIAVNIPAAELEAVDTGIVASRHVTIVGKPDRQTPVLASKVHQLNFSPFWHVPESIVIRDIMPRMREDPEYLNANLIRAYDKNQNEIPTSMIDWTSVEDATRYLYRQDPGEDLNALGAVKINFHNSHAVFLHDTPQKDLFSNNYRAFSSGCVRVQNVEHLITWILQNQRQGEDWSRDRVDAVIRSAERLDVDLSVQIPLFLVYITAWANPDGTAQFRRDLYGRDGVGQLAVTY